MMDRRDRRTAREDRTAERRSGIDRRAAVRTLADPTHPYLSEVFGDVPPDDDRRQPPTPAGTYRGAIARIIASIRGR